MKIFLMGVSAVFVAISLFVSCKGKTSNNSDNLNRAATATPTGTVDKTLNGFPGETARAMIANFADQDNYKKDQGKKSVYAWYSTEQIAAMDSLLKDEADSVDGVRICLGSNNNPAGTASAKLNVQMFLVSTRERLATDPSGNGSLSIDYYTHKASYLTRPSVPFGYAMDDKAAMGLLQGGKLYNTGHPPLLDHCANPDEHYIDDVTAFQWVEKRHDGNPKRDESGYNTMSEWFDICFVQGAFDAIISKHNKISGLRIYLGKGYIDPDNPGDGERDVFVLVPTQTITDAMGNKTEVDDYQCLEDLGNFLNCEASAERHSFWQKWISKSPKKQSHLKEDLKRYGYWYGGYDKGELCPDKCN